MKSERHLLFLLITTGCLLFVGSESGGPNMGREKSIVCYIPSGVKAFKVRDFIHLAPVNRRTHL